MKKIFLGLSMLTLLFSCTKSPNVVENENTTNLQNSLLALSQKYNLNNNNPKLTSKKGPNTTRVILSDAMGAGTGAPGGPFLAAFMAVVYSCYDIESQGYSLFTAPITDKGGNNPNNPYNDLGNNHNQVVYFYINGENEGIGYQDMNSIISDKLKSIDSNITIPINQINTNHYTMYSNIMNSDIYDELGVNGILDNAINAGILDDTEADILKIYFNNLFQIEDVVSAVNYSIDFENIIGNDQELGQSSKDKLLQMMTVARNSKALYENTDLE